MTGNRNYKTYFESIRQWGTKMTTQKMIFLILVLGPVFLAYSAYGLYPNLLTVYYSFFRWDGVSDKIFVGIYNYEKLITDPHFYNALLHNFIYVAIIPVLIILFSIVLAYLLVNICNNKESYFYKVVFFLPNVLSSIVIALLWVFIYDGQWGILNSLLNILGIKTNNFYWLADERTALLALVPLSVWVGVGFYVIIFMNAMITIPKSLYESAILEGAGNMTKLFKITLPLISGVVRVAAIFLVLNMFKGFETIMVMTGGGPNYATNVVGLYMFSYAFSTSQMGGFDTHDYGYASTIGVFLFLVLFFANMVVQKVFKNDATEY